MNEARKKARALTGSFDVILRRKPALVLEAEKRIVVLILQRRHANPTENHATL